MDAPASGRDDDQQTPRSVEYDEQIRRGQRDPQFEAGNSATAETIRLLRNVLGGLPSESRPAITLSGLTGDTRSDPLGNPVDLTPPEIRPERFEFLEVVGTGAFGVVWKAFDQELRRTVAIKVPYHELAAHADLQRRFLRESRAVARLNHPSIVRVLDAGQDGSRLWFVSEFVDGPSLTECLKSAPLSIRHAVSVVRDLADAVHHAHLHGVLHRDIKPDNILLDQAEESVEGPGLPRLTDFGLARIVDEDQHLSRTGVLVGTPRYMAPEQLTGDVAEHGAATDVYALGVVLYESLAGHGPFDKESSVAGRVAGIGKPLAPLRKQRRGVPRDLSTICQKCLEPEPDKRYASAQALREDLQRFLDGRPTVARPLPILEQLARWTIRNPSLAALLVVVVAASCLVAGIATWNKRVLSRQNRQLQTTLLLLKEERDKVERESQLRAEKEQLVRSLAFRSGLQQAYDAFDEGKYLQARALLRKSAELVSDSDVPQEFQLLDASLKHRFQIVGDFRTTLTEHCTVPGTQHTLVAGTSGDCRLLDSVSGRQLREYSVPLFEVHAMAVSDDGRWFAAGGTTNLLGYAWVYVLDLESGKVIHSFRAGRTTVESVAFAPGATHVACGCRYGQVTLYDVAAESTRQFDSGSRNAGIEFNSDGTQLVFAAKGPGPDTLQIVDVPTGVSTASIPVADGIMMQTQVPATQLVAVATRHDHVQLFSRTLGRLVATLRADESFQQFNSHSLACSRSGNFVAVGNAEGRVTLWHIASLAADDTHNSETTEPPDLSALSECQMHESRVLSIQWESDETLTSIGEAGTVSRLLNVNPGAGSTRGEQGTVTTAIPLHRGFRICDSGGQVTAVPPSGGALPQLSDVFPRVEQPAWSTQSPIRTMAVSPDGAQLVWVDAFGTLTVADLTGQPRCTYNVGQGSNEAVQINAIAMSPDSEFLAITGTHNRCQFLSLDSDITVERDLPLTSDGRSVDISPNGQLIVIGGDFEQIKVFNRKDGRMETTIPTGLKTAVCRFTRSGDTVVVGHEDGSIRWWSLKSKQQVRSIRPHRSRITGFALFDNDRLLVSIDNTGRIALSDAAIGEIFGTLYPQLPHAENYRVPPFLRRNRVTGEILAVRMTTPGSSQLLRWSLLPSGQSPGDPP